MVGMMIRMRRDESRLALAWLTMMITAGSAAAVTFESRLEPATVIQGRTSVLVVALAAEVGSLPDIDHPLINGASVSFGGSSQQFSMINGAVSVSKTWRWHLTPHSNQDVAIPALTVDLGGVTYRTQPLVLRVQAGGTSSVIGTGNRTAAPPASSDQPAPVMPGPGDPHFATLELDRTTAYVGEQVVMTFRYYQSVLARGFDRPEYSPPRTEGFWREQIGEPSSFRESRGGETYQVTEIRYALTPTRSGDLMVEPARVVLPADLFADIFSQGRRRRAAGPGEIWTAHRKLEVLDLPVPRPANFSGLVSRQASLSVTLDRDSVPKGEAVSAVLMIEADGPLKSVSAPVWRLPEAFQVHDVGDEVQSHASGGRLRGAYREERILQPLEAGHWLLPPASLTYFDTRQRRYVTLEADRVELTATPSDFRIEDGRSARPQDPLRFGEELAFVRSPDDQWRARSNVFVASSGWWALLGLPFVLLTLWRFVLARSDAERRDPDRRRRRLALTTARNSLREAARSAEKTGMPGAIETAFRSYVADRSGRPLASIGRNEVSAHASSRLDPERARTIELLMEQCASVRYGGVVSAGSTPEIMIDEAIRLLEHLDRSSAGGNRTGLGVLLLLGMSVVASPAMAEPLSPGPDPARLVAEGNRAYTDGELDLALDRYRQAASLGADPLLDYNIGNTHARQSERGLAILHYRRALRFDPRNRDLRNNLAWVVENAGDSRLPDAPKPMVIKILDRGQSALTLDEWGCLLLLLVWVGAGIVATIWWRGEPAPWQRRVLLTVASITVLVGSVTAFRWWDEMRVRHAVIIHESIVRSGPDASFPEVLEAVEGLAVRIVDDREGWRQVSLGGDWQGWIPAKDLGIVRHESEETP